jgi:alkylation response protein AidB-like acyl-CoA dehydrogenase
MRRAVTLVVRRGRSDLISRYALSAEQQELKEQVRSWAERELAPRAAAIDKENLFPADMWRKLGALGVLGVTVAPQYGGLGLGYLDHCLAMEEISRASGSVGLSYGAHSNLCVNQIHRNGTPEQASHAFLLFSALTCWGPRRRPSICRGWWRERRWAAWP